MSSTNAPTTRETADHAELADQARRDLEWSCLTTVRPATVLALLSEIAALRGERTFLMEQKEGAEDAIFDALTRATQAERQRDELRRALEFYAQPIWSIRGEFPEPSPHSEYRPDCGDTARQALANQGADQ